MVALSVTIILCRVSHLSLYSAECCYDKYIYAKLSAYVEYIYPECIYSECICAECIYAECIYAECIYAECIYAENVNVNVLMC